MRFRMTLPWDMHCSFTPRGALLLILVQLSLLIPQFPDELRDFFSPQIFRSNSLLKKVFRGVHE